MYAYEYAMCVLLKLNLSDSFTQCITSFLKGYGGSFTLEARRHKKLNLDVFYIFFQTFNAIKLMTPKTLGGGHDYYSKNLKKLEKFPKC